MRPRLVTFLVCALAAPAAADLSSGVRAFREGHFEQALTEVRNGPQTPEASFYAGAALYKLGRHEEALEALEGALEADPALAAGVGSVYLGLLRYELKLYRSAREPFERAAKDSPGTRVGELAGEHLKAIDGLPRAGDAALRWYRDRGLERAAAGRPRLALAYLLELRRLDPLWSRELVAIHAAAAWNALGRAREALAALGDARGPGAELERGRALVALGRAGEARQSLAAAAGSGEPPWADAARKILETLQ